MDTMLWVLKQGVRGMLGAAMAHDCRLPGAVGRHHLDVRDDARRQLAHDMWFRPVRAHWRGWVVVSARLDGRLAA